MMPLAFSTAEFNAALATAQANKSKWDGVTAVASDVQTSLSRLDTAENKLLNLNGAIKFFGSFLTKADFETAAAGFNYDGFLSSGVTPAYIIDEGNVIAIAYNTSITNYVGTPDFQVPNLFNVGFEYSAQESLDSAKINALVGQAVAPLAVQADVEALVSTTVAPLATKVEVATAKGEAIDAAALAQEPTNTDVAVAITQLKELTQELAKQ